MKHLFLRLFFLAVFILAVGSAEQGNAASKKLHKVFILHSYERDHVCGGPQHDGVVEALAANGYVAGGNLDIEVYAMDTKQRNNTPELIKREGEKALRKVWAYGPDVLVTLDDNAFREVGLKFAGTNTPVVFSGMNAQPEDYQTTPPWLDSRAHPGHNITGVYEKLHFVDAIRVQKNIIPGLKKVLVFTDNSPTGKAIFKQIELEMQQETVPCQVDVYVASSWEDYVETLKKACLDQDVGTLYPGALLLKDKAGKTYTAKEILGYTVKYCSKPSIPVNYGFAELGVLGGAGVDFKDMGRQAGTQVARILNGERAGDLPIEDTRRYALVFNMARAAELGIVIPPDILLAADEVYTD
ncbi:MAG: ABC transporter substrate-binding protein [Desulfovibrio sp.]|uniref:ABC transporter substrate-binding protein n=1 Tax=Desulfovibrio sp. 7SRBS1 TaxID=3378064 RepID=UPI003B3DC604